MTVNARLLTRIAIAAAVAILAPTAVVRAQDAAAANALQQFSDAFEWAANQVKPATVMIRLGNSVGTGAIIEPSGYIITNNHVVKTASVVDVYLPTRRNETFKGRVLGVNPQADLALVKIEGGPFPVARLANSDQVRSGHLVIAIGSPRGLSQTVTTGIISGRRGAGLGQRLQHDAPINPGNSGGPLVNLDGEIIGVNNSIRSAADRGNNGIGFAIPSNVVRQLLPSLLAGGTGPPPPPMPNAGRPGAPRAYLGVELQDIEDNDPRKAQVPGGKAILIVGVAPDSPAEKGGLKEGDVIVRYNHLMADTVDNLAAYIGNSKPGDSLALQILRDGKLLTVTVRLGDRP
jgi:serine protease Do